MLGTVLNIIAWVGSVAFAVLLIKDFVKTEKYYKKIESESEDQK